MSESFHGHEVMFMMAESGKQFTRASLKAAIDEKFGADARFHTCSAQDMTAEQLIDFLDARGKFTGQAESFTADTEKVCNHEHGHDH
jgi:probable metal-binding protein